MTKIEALMILEMPIEKRPLLRYCPDRNAKTWHTRVFLAEHSEEYLWEWDSPTTLRRCKESEFLTANNGNKKNNRWRIIFDLSTYNSWKINHTDCWDMLL